MGLTKQEKKTHRRKVKRLDNALWVLRQNGFSLNQPPPHDSPYRSYYDSAKDLGVLVSGLPPVSFYESYEWRRTRYDVLAKSDGRCELCGRSKHQGVRLHVDHIEPRSLRPDLELEPSNLQVLCADCNIGKSNRDNRDFRKTC